MSAHLQFPRVTGSGVGDMVRALGGLRGPRFTPTTDAPGTAAPVHALIAMPATLETIARRIRAAARLGDSPATAPRPRTVSPLPS